MKKRNIILLVVAILGIGIVAAIYWREQTKPIPLKLEFFWASEGHYDFEITQDGEIITQKSEPYQQRTLQKKILSSNELRSINRAIRRIKKDEELKDVVIYDGSYYTLRIPTKNLEIFVYDYGLSKDGKADDLVEMIFELSPIPVETKSGEKPLRTNFDEIFGTGWRERLG